MDTNMFLSILCISWICLLRISPSLALTLQPVSSLTLTASPTNKTLPGPALLLLNVSAVGGKYPLGPDLPDPTCNGELLGFDLNRYSCLQAWSTIPLSKDDVRFEERSSNDFDVKLPRRFAGRKCFVLFSISKTCSAVNT